MVGVSEGDEPLTLTRCHSCGLPQLYETFEGWNVRLWLGLQLKGHKRGNFLFFFSLLSFDSLLL